MVFKKKQLVCGNFVIQDTNKTVPFDYVIQRCLSLHSWVLVTILVEKKKNKIRQTDGPCLLKRGGGQPNYFILAYGSRRILVMSCITACFGVVHYYTSLLTYAIEHGTSLKPGSQPHAQFFDRTIFSLIPIFWNRIRFY